MAIAGEGVFFGSDQKAVAFREWLDTHEADVEALDGGTFKDNDQCKRPLDHAPQIAKTAQTP
ncbi:hypothetical protein D3C85_1875500 [compost metagenome]